MGPKILLCDDELHILRAAEFKFRRAGLEVALASDGEQGWQMIQTQRPDILVTDYQMPRLDGLGLVRRIRSAPELANLPIILLTAKGFELNQNDLKREWGLIAVLSKPFSPRDLLARVEQALGLHAPQEAAR